MESKRTKAGGRVAGTPNKSTLVALDVFGDFCPLGKVLEKLRTEEIDCELYINTCLKLMKFKFPERKSVEHLIDPSTFADEELIKDTIGLLKGLGVTEI